MSTDAQGQATEGQSPVEGYEALNADEAVKLLRESDPDTRERILDFERAHDNRKSVLQAGERASHHARRTNEETQGVKTVQVRFDSAHDGVTTELDAGGYRLQLGQACTVPVAVFDQLTSGDNARLFNVSKVED